MLFSSIVVSTVYKCTWVIKNVQYVAAMDKAVLTYKSADKVYVFLMNH